MEQKGFLSCLLTGCNLPLSNHRVATPTQKVHSVRGECDWPHRIGETDVKCYRRVLTKLSALQSSLYDCYVLTFVDDILCNGTRS